MARIETRERGQRRTIGGCWELVDVRSRYPVVRVRRRTLNQIAGIAIHHDGIAYAGTTLQDDLERLDAIYTQAIDVNRWGRFPYHLVASPGNRLFYTLDLDLIGTHVARQNTPLAGIAMMGDFTEGREPTEEQLCATARGNLVVFSALSRVVSIRGHKDWDPAAGTHCPGGTWHQVQRELLYLTAKKGELCER